MGSLVAASFPELVERCVFIDSLGPFSFSTATTPKRLRRSIESRREYGRKNKNLGPGRDKGCAIEFCFAESRIMHL